MNPLHGGAHARNLDMFGKVPDTYPDAPGYQRGSDTSEAAARAFKVTAATLRGRVLETYLNAHGGLTCNEASERCEIPLINCRPRVAELHTNGFLEDTGERRTNANGRTAAV